MNYLFLDLASRTGYSVFNVFKDKASLVEAGYIQLDKGKPDFLRVKDIDFYLDKIFVKCPIEVVVAENITFERNSAIVFLAQLQGQIKRYLHSKGLDLIITNSQVLNDKGKPTDITASTWRGRTNGVGLLVKDKGTVKKEEWVEYVHNNLFDCSYYTVTGLHKIDDNIADSLGIALYYIITNLKIKLENIDFSNGRREDYEFRKSA